MLGCYYTDVALELVTYIDLYRLIDKPITKIITLMLRTKHHLIIYDLDHVLKKDCDPS